MGSKKPPPHFDMHVTIISSFNYHKNKIKPHLRKNKASSFIVVEKRWK